MPPAPRPRAGPAHAAAAPPLRAAMLLPLLLVPCAWAQGLRPSTDSTLGAAASVESLSNLLAQAQSFRALFKDSPKVACSQGKQSVCGSGASQDAYATLYLAMSAQAYDARSQGLASPVRDQKSCMTCTSFAVISAAEAAVSAALRKSAADKKWSVQGLHYCQDSSEVRTCGSTSTMVEAVKTLVEQAPKNKDLVLLDKCLPYTIYEASNFNQKACRPRCKDQDPDLAQGKFSFKRLNSPWDVQRHIRLWGGVVTRVDIFSDFKPFFVKSPRGVYKGDKSGKLVEYHAITLVGYNNTGRFWIFKNSWGPTFADGGYGKISYDATFTNILSPADTFGLMFEAYTPPPLPYQLCPHPKRRGCHMTKPPRGSYASKVADDLDLQLPEMLMDNLGVIKDVSKPLGGAHIIVCDLSQETLKRVTLQAACPTPPPAKCKENLPPEPVRTVNLRRMGRVGDMAEIRVGWSLPPGDACVRQYKVEILNLSTLFKTSRTIEVQPDTVGSVIFKTIPFAAGTKGPAYLFNVVASNKAGSSAARSLTVQT